MVAVGGRQHRVVVRQAPLLAIVVRRQPVQPQMAAQYAVMLAVLEADQVGLLDRVGDLRLRERACRRLCPEVTRLDDGRLHRVVVRQAPLLAIVVRRQPEPPQMLLQPPTPLAVLETYEERLLDRGGNFRSCAPASRVPVPKVVPGDGAEVRGDGAEVRGDGDDRGPWCDRVGIAVGRTSESHGHRINECGEFSRADLVARKGRLQDPGRATGGQFIV